MCRSDCEQILSCLGRATSCSFRPEPDLSSSRGGSSRGSAFNAVAPSSLHRTFILSTVSRGSSQPPTAFGQQALSSTAWNGQ